MEHTKPEHPAKPRLVVHVGVTGHRSEDLQGYDRGAIHSAVATAFQRIRAVVEAVYREQGAAFSSEPPILRMFSRLADGSDLIAAREALEQGFELHCPLPFPRDSYRNDIMPSEQKTYDELLHKATHIVELDGDRTEEKQSFFESRQMVLRHSDVLIAIWDPVHHASGVWGTSRLVDAARHDVLLVIHIPPDAPAKVHLDMREEDADIHRVPAAELESHLRALLAPPADESAHSTRVSRWLIGREEFAPYDAFLRERQYLRTFGFVWRGSVFYRSARRTAFQLLCYGHSGRLRRLLGCSPSFSVFKYLLPCALLATMTKTVLPSTDT